jgi:hypothetical protein
LPRVRAAGTGDARQRAPRRRHREPFAESGWRVRAARRSAVGGLKSAEIEDPIEPFPPRVRTRHPPDRPRLSDLEPSLFESCAEAPVRGVPEIGDADPP